MADGETSEGFLPRRCPIMAIAVLGGSVSADGTLVPVDSHQGHAVVVHFSAFRILTLI